MMILRKVAKPIRDDCVRIKTILFANGIDESLAACETLWRGISFHNYREDWKKLPQTDLEVWEVIAESVNIVE